VALAECCFTGPTPIGVSVTLEDAIRPDALLFGESTGRVVIASSEPDRLLALAAKHGVPARCIGETGGERLRVSPPGDDIWIDSEVEALRQIHREAIPRRLASR
jgi:phosphoribosylformylglycinamidine synthase